jgi:hypothetical protein
MSGGFSSEVSASGGEDSSMRSNMETYPRAVVEQAMKMPEVILRAMAKKISWWQAAEILGISYRQMRRWQECYQ